MSEERFDRLMRAAAESYNRPPEPPLDEMWAAIEHSRRAELTVVHALPRRRAWTEQPWVRMAAILVVGVGIGRLTAGRSAVLPVGSEPAAQANAAAPAVPGGYQAVTDHYLGQAAALLIALPGELNAHRSDRNYLERADDLLLQTRLMLDSPAATDPSLRTLFEDLEVVLVQVVRLQSDRDPTKVDLLHQAIEQGDVIPRLRDAVVDHISP